MGGEEQGVGHFGVTSHVRDISELVIIEGRGSLEIFFASLISDFTFFTEKKNLANAALNPSFGCAFCFTRPFPYPYPPAT